MSNEIKYFIRKVCKCGPDHDCKQVTKVEYEAISEARRRGTTFKEEGIVQDVYELCSDCGGDSNEDQKPFVSTYQANLEKKAMLARSIPKPAPTGAWPFPR